MTTDVASAGFAGQAMLEQHSFLLSLARTDLTRDRLREVASWRERTKVAWQVPHLLRMSMKGAIGILNCATLSCLLLDSNRWSTIAQPLVEVLLALKALGTTLYRQAQ